MNRMCDREKEGQICGFDFGSGNWKDGVAIFQTGEECGGVSSVVSMLCLSCLLDIQGKMRNGC